MMQTPVKKTTAKITATITMRKKLLFGCSMGTTLFSHIAKALDGKRSD
jgi:hypothetical protein